MDTTFISLSVSRGILGKFISFLLEFHVAVYTRFKANENVAAVSLEANIKTVAIRNPKLITLDMK